LAALFFLSFFWASKRKKGKTPVPAFEEYQDLSRRYF
jgi:hypothetical protein